MTNVGLTLRAGPSGAVTVADRLLSGPRITIRRLWTPKRGISSDLTHAPVRRALDMSDKLELTIAVIDNGIHDSACIRARYALIFGMSSVRAGLPRGGCGWQRQPAPGAAPARCRPSGRPSAITPVWSPSPELAGPAWPQASRVR